MTRPTFDTDPSGLVAAIGATVGALLALLVAFGIDLSADQISAILAVISTAGPLVLGLWIRRHAYAPATVAKIAAEQAGEEPNR